MSTHSRSQVAIPERNVLFEEGSVVQMLLWSGTVLLNFGVFIHRSIAILQGSFHAKRRRRAVDNDVDILLCARVAFCTSYLWSRLCLSTKISFTFVPSRFQINLPPNMPF